MSRKSARRMPRGSEPAARTAGRWKAVWFVLAALAVAAFAAILALAPLWADRSSASLRTGAQRVVVTMAGFAPGRLTARAGSDLTLEFVNPDSRFHTDGGGWHQFAIDALGVDVRMPPSSRRTITLDDLPAGTYEFYCDVCCGGKENPSMRGVLEVTG